MTEAAPGRWHAAGYAEVPAHDEWLTVPESERLQSLRFTKRREEARLSRWTAKHAVALALGLSTTDVARLRDVVIRNAADGAPEAFLGGSPAPVSISMTDRADWSVCIVTDGAVGVGCDLELVEPRSAAFVGDWFTPAERSLVAAHSHLHDELANTIWSAKESALKVLRTGLRRDTRSVEVDLDPGGGAGWSPLEVRATEGGSYPGWWRRFGRFVLTCAASGPLPAPVSLVEPSPLESAAPTHAWMAQPLRPAP